MVVIFEHSRKKKHFLILWQERMTDFHSHCSLKYL